MIVYWSLIGRKTPETIEKSRFFEWHFQKPAVRSRLSPPNEEATKELSLVVLFLLISLMADEVPSRRQDLTQHAQRQGGGDAYIRVRGV